MFNGYKVCKQTYNQVYLFVENNTEITADLKEALLKLMRRYQIAITFMEPDEIKKIIEECFKKGSTTPLTIELRNGDDLDVQDGGVGEKSRDYYDDEYYSM